MVRDSLPGESILLYQLFAPNRVDDTADGDEIGRVSDKENTLSPMVSRKEGVKDASSGAGFGALRNRRDSNSRSPA